MPSAQEAHDKIWVSEVTVTPVGQGAKRATPPVPASEPAVTETTSKAAEAAAIKLSAVNPRWISRLRQTHIVQGIQRRQRKGAVMAALRKEKEMAAGENETAPTFAKRVEEGWARLRSRAEDKPAQAPAQTQTVIVTPPGQESEPVLTSLAVPVEEIPAAEQEKPKSKRRSLTPGERVLRDCAVCAAILLGVFAMKNIADPAVQQTAKTIQDAMTTDVDVSQQLGKLTFVWNWMPESLQQVWMPQQNTPLGFDWPVSGEVVQEYEASAPWWEINTANLDVAAAQDGYVTNIARDQDGTYVVTLQHYDAWVTCYANLQSVGVSLGDKVEMGSTIGKLYEQDGKGKLHFEVRRAGTSKDPKDMMKPAEPAGDDKG